MSQPLSDPPPPRPTRVQASLRRRAYRRGRGTADLRPTPVDELDLVAEPDAKALADEALLDEREERLDEAREADEAAALVDDDLDLTDAELAEVSELDVAGAADADGHDDDYDDEDDLPGGGDPEHYDELDLGAVVHEPEQETVEDELDEQPEADDEDEGEALEAAAVVVADDLADDVVDDETDATADEPVTQAQAAPTPAPVAPTAEPRRRRDQRYVPARRVRRTIRRVDPLSLGKLALVFNLCFLVMVIVAGVIIWSAASASGSIGDIEGFVEDIGFDDFQLDGGQLLRGVAVGGLVLALAGSFFAFILALLFNLLADLVGGVRITMVEPDESA